MNRIPWIGLYCAMAGVAACAQDSSAKDDIRVLIKRLISTGASAPKGEFETSAEFEARRGLSTDSKATLRFIVADIYHASFAYDADTSMLTAALNTLSISFSGEHSFYAPLPTVQLANVRHGVRRYMGTNAHGAKAMVTSIVSDDYGIVIGPASGIRVLTGQPTTFTFPLDREQAKAIKPHLQLALICTLTDSKIHKTSKVTRATFDDPTEITGEGYYANVSLHSVQIVDGRSGEILTEFGPQSKKHDIQAH